MAKPSREKGKASKTRLLTIAASEFAKRGYNAKISDIVAAAGLTQPAFYIYYPSKEAIFEELVQAFHNRVRTLIENSLLDSATEKQNVYEHIKTKLEMFFEFLSAEPDLTRIGLFVDPNRAQVRAEMVRMVQENLVKEQQAGYFRSNLDMEFVAECLVSMIEQLTETRLLPGLSSAERLATQVVDLLLKGMIKE
ncbi:TetR/AcrR family transcriptional regulator [Paenibacillus sp. MSJ-34]|uniref:TetR/AcrR family transcriptional regulator n=1 Tax=Paenibacillus sp. MSJ-34 TaxID=2841529 RepID=UPI001C124D82|nr:TetR/AcrR family transcriptional regulator [Paenibacillus sp. MSJ-34]MBU5444790.1 TetR/AcrR family transcriptional regulator [Paenibacillus sp. MSJ-34]